MNHHNHINYIEIPCKDIPSAKAFFSQVFDWDFVDYGPDYCSFANAGIDGGFYTSPATVSIATGSPLVVLYSKHLTETEQRVVEAKGVIIKPTFEFPGGKRFHFADPTGNEYAVWSE